MPKMYSDAESVGKIAASLIPQHHPELASARMLYAFVDVGSKKNDLPVYGKVRKITGLLEYYLEADFVIEVALDHWNELRDTQRAAVVDHLLERCTGVEDEKSGAMKWTVREPEVQEFATILRRQGAWHEGLNAFVSIAKQINLDALVAEAEQEIVTNRT